MVVLQFTLLTAIVFPAQHDILSAGIAWKITGIILMSAGLLIGLLAVGRINKFLSVMPKPVPGAQLITFGIYKLIRHPMYAALIAAGMGYAIFTLDIHRALLTLLLLVLFEFKTQYEELRMVELFPEYKSYQQQTGKFLPRLFK